MLVKKDSDIKGSDITDEQSYLSRREFIKVSSIASAGAALAASSLPSITEGAINLDNVQKGMLSLDETPTDFKKATQYNNFYEFSTDKKQPALIAQHLKTDPWKLRVEGEIEKPADYHLEDFIKPYALEERIYRFRCVETWSMVVPWLGISLQQVIKRLNPSSKAKYLEFTTLFDPEQMPGQRRKTLQWPYVEGLRIDEAMHPLTMLVVGMYGKILPNQNGAPIRLIVPWKYGFKSIKSIVKLRFTESQPATSWNIAGPEEYGFYANVNPKVDHPRWSQRRERRLGDFFKRNTSMFNGYADQVAKLYSGMDLAKHI